MEKIHEIKLNIEFCDAVMVGEKNFEIRFNDRGYQRGDNIRFIPVGKFGVTTHPIDERLYRITYVMNGYGLKDGYVVLGIKDSAKENEIHERLGMR